MIIFLSHIGLHCIGLGYMHLMRLNTVLGHGFVVGYVYFRIFTPLIHTIEDHYCYRIDVHAYILQVMPGLIPRLTRDLS